MCAPIRQNRIVNSRRFAERPADCAKQGTQIQADVTERGPRIAQLQCYSRVATCNNLFTGEGILVKRAESVSTKGCAEQIRVEMRLGEVGMSKFTTLLTQNSTKTNKLVALSNDAERPAVALTPLKGVLLVLIICCWLGFAWHSRQHKKRYELDNVHDGQKKAI